MFEMVFGLRTLGGRKLAKACILWPLCSANDTFEQARSKLHHNAFKYDPCSSSLKSFSLFHMIGRLHVCVSICRMFTSRRHKLTGGEDLYASFHEVDGVYNLQNNFQFEQLTIFLFLFFFKSNNRFKNEDKFSSENPIQQLCIIEATHISSSAVPSLTI